MRLTSIRFRPLAIAGCLLALGLSSAGAADLHVFGDVFIESSSPKLIFADLADQGGPGYEWIVSANSFDFSIQDLTAGTIPFQIEKGAKSFSLVINSNGHIGMGTSAPARDLHINSSDFPTIRLHQTNAVFAPQVFDLGSYFDGFFIDDVDAGTRPFAIKPGARLNSLVVNSDGYVGVGTPLPGTRLHVLQAGSPGAETLARFSVSDDSIGKLEINNATTTNGTFIPRLQGYSKQTNAALIMEGVISSDSGTGPAIVYNARSVGSGLLVRPLVVYRNNNVAKVTIAANGNVTATSFITASSRTLKDNIVDLESRKASEVLRQLNPVEFTYKDDPTADNRVGFIAEDVPSIVAELDRQSVPVMDVLAVATRVVKDQQKTIDEQKALLEEQNTFLDEQRKINDQQRKLNELLIQRLAEAKQRRADLAAGRSP